jgi:hypothetical protein
MASAFDEKWDEPFRSSPFRLRFELGGEEFDNSDQPVPRFMQALTRSRSVQEATFAQSSRLWAVVRSWQSDGLEALWRIGFRSSPVAEWRVVEEVPEQPIEVIWQAFDVTGDKSACDTLLWLSIVNEMPIDPKAPVESYLADMDRGILLHVYDDRGMDLTALNPSAIEDIRRRFDDWLLPYDRSRIEAVFGP